VKKRGLSVTGPRFLRAYRQSPFFLSPHTLRSIMSDSSQIVNETPFATLNPLKAVKWPKLPRRHEYQGDVVGPDSWMRPASLEIYYHLEKLAQTEWYTSENVKKKRFPAKELGELQSDLRELKGQYTSIAQVVGFFPCFPYSPCSEPRQSDLLTTSSCSLFSTTSTSESATR